MATKVTFMIVCVCMYPLVPPVSLLFPIVSNTLCAFWYPLKSSYVHLHPCTHLQVPPLVTCILLDLLHLCPPFCTHLYPLAFPFPLWALTLHVLLFSLLHLLYALYLPLVLLRTPCAPCNLLLCILTFTLVLPVSTSKSYVPSLCSTPLLVHTTSPCASMSAPLHVLICIPLYSLNLLFYLPFVPVCDPCTLCVPRNLIGWGLPLQPIT